MDRAIGNDKSRGTCGEGCGCGPTRRDALKGIALGVAAAMVPQFAMAGPFERADFEKLVPADKKLNPKWVQSLYERGTPTVYQGQDLKYIGMPIGGLCAGQLYLGGDGRLWHWDIFNQEIHTGDGHYAHPVLPEFPVDQGFALELEQSGQVHRRTLDRRGFPDVRFTGQYPIGFVEYSDPTCPVTVALEAFSPFIPLNADDSSLPATVLRFTLKNVGDKPVKPALSGWLENAGGLNSADVTDGKHHNRIIREHNLLLLECSAIEAEQVAAQSQRPPMVFEDFEGDDYGKWTTSGEAFGSGPTAGATAPSQKLANFQGKKLANSFFKGSDQAQGTLVSPEFKIERRFINFLIGGGNHPNQTCINLLINGRVVRTATGRNSDRMEWASWNVSQFENATARIEIIDRASGGWGHIDIDQIEFADEPRRSAIPFAKLPDVGTLVLALLEPTASDAGTPSSEHGNDTVSLSQKIVGRLTRAVELKPGESHISTFVLAWHFPNLSMRGVKGGIGRYYATRFESASAVARYVAQNFDRLYQQTKLWHETWYDSSLPYWLLDRTLLNISILATSTAMRFADGRFYGWEGVGCCEGTCTHVWQYEQAMGRLFPEFDILLRERVDFNPEVGFHPQGWIGHRGEFLGPAVDGQAGTILRAYRDHQMSADDAFLKRNWPAIKRAIGWMIGQDGNNDGILEGPQHNTLDAEWFGPVPWLSGLYLAAVTAGREMAREMDDGEFAGRCDAISKVGIDNLVKRTFNGDYFVQIPDPKHKDSVGSYDGCEIDQVMGQSWAHQVGLGRVFPQEQNRKALEAIYRYNFTPDVGPYRNAHKPGRWYAMPGEAGLLMCSWPHGEGSRIHKAFDYYFNECMNGFEHEAASHMIWEGLLEEGLVIERALHDRYSGGRRNPWNEVECGDHYARSMASYGVFTAITGYSHHGPKGHLGFAPKLKPEDFKAAFTTAQGWGSFSQRIANQKLDAQIALGWGQLVLQTLSLELPKDFKVTQIDGAPGAVQFATNANVLTITFPQKITLSAGQKLELTIH